MDALGQVLLSAQQFGDVTAQIGGEASNPSTSMAAAAAITARTSSEIWMFPSSSGRETYSFPSAIPVTLLFSTRSFSLYHKIEKLQLVFLRALQNHLSLGLDNLHLAGLHPGLVGDNFSDFCHVRIGEAALRADTTTLTLSSPIKATQSV